MVKHTQVIGPLLRTNCLSVFDYFVWMALKGLTRGIYWNLSSYAKVIQSQAMNKKVFNLIKMVLVLFRQRIPLINLGINK